MKRFVILPMLLFVVSTVWADDTKLPVPELEKGDVLFGEEYPYRTVKNTSCTVYQIARLGFANVASFQNAYGLKADGVIGPKTQQKAESEFNKQFRVTPRKYADLNMLSLSLSSELKENNIAVTVTMRNKSEEPLRIIGSIIYDSNGSFLFQDPTLTLSKRFCTRENGRITYSINPSAAEVVICAKGTTITPLKQVTVTSFLMKLKTNQSGSMAIGTSYIDTTFSTGTVSVSGMIPESEEDNVMTIYFKQGKLEISEKDLDTVLNKLDKSKKYKIEGCLCKEDKGTDEALMAIATRRAEKIAKILIDHGFPVKNITLCEVN